MKKLFLTMFIALCGMAVFAEPLWDGDLSTVSLQAGKKLQDVSVKTEDGALLITGTSEGNSVTYIAVEIRFKPFVLGNQLISMDVSSDDSKTTNSFYVRLQNAKRQNVLSFQQWGNPLKETPVKYHLIHGGAYPVMKWEPEEIKAPATDLVDRIVFFIGTRGDGKPMSVKIKNIERSGDAMQSLPERTGQPLSVSANASLARAVKDGDTVFTDSLVLSDQVSYTYVQVPFSGDLTGKKLAFTGATSTPGITGALYVRGYNSKKECILSYASWGGLLKADAKEFILTPGQSGNGLKWEADRVKAGAAQELNKLEFIIGTNKNANKRMSAEFKNIHLQ
ncbi:MAG: hypothetical protein J6S73_02195 [Lentisphaeria bacterium]|nr:hypothetical protein [Lentisphaeria bacterium]